MKKRQQQKKIKAEKQAAAQRKQTVTRLLLILVAAVVIIAIGTVATQRLALDIPKITKISNQDIIKGYDSAPLTLIEYSDFQCPACRVQHQTIRSAWKDIRRHVKLVYRHFPLTRLHPHAMLAARYSEAAHRQGKFWQMHDLMFDSQPNWSKLDDPSEQFDAFAKELDLDMVKLKSDIESDAVQKKIRADIASGGSAGVKGTPTFFLDGELLSNIRGREQFIDAIKTAAEFK